jgi:carbon storage regulator
MLVLSRKLGERVFIGNDIVVTIVAVQGDRVRVGVDCPAPIPVHREEVYQRIRNERRAEATGRATPASQYRPEFA